METRVESRLSALGQMALVAAILAGALSMVFLPLMRYSLAMKDLHEYRMWIGEWVLFDVTLTAALCRRELGVLLGLRSPGKKKE